MKRFTLSLGFGLFFLLAVNAFAAVPQLINFQGVLRDSGGNPVADGSYSVTFQIYDAPTAGTELWTETQSVTTSSGVFNVLLGATNPVPDSAFNGPNRYLGIAVEFDPELSPRFQLVSVGYAYRVNSVDGALGGTINGNINVTGKATIGSGHTNTAGSTFIAGFGNTVSGTGAAVGGGIFNTASDSVATVGGGYGNNATSFASTVGGGSSNIATGFASTVGGGSQNRAEVSGATIGGGSTNKATGSNSFVGGGGSNSASDLYSTVGGGSYDSASNTWATVSGGYNNKASGSGATVGGGKLNRATDSSSTVGGGYFNSSTLEYATVSGGFLNMASGDRSTVSGGSRNVASGYSGSVGGGQYNFARGQFSTVNGGGGGDYADSNQAFGNWSVVPGGRANLAKGNYSFAAGRKAKANSDGAFVWADAADADFASTGTNQFLIRASGGVGIGTNSPEVALQVDQDAEVVAFTGDNNQGLRISGSNTNDRWVFLGFDGGQGKNISQIGSRQTATGSYLSFGTSSAYGFGITNEAMTIDPSGNVGLGLPAPAHPMHLASGAHVTAGGTWTNASSRSYKTDVQPLQNREYAEILKKLENLDVVRFRYKAEPKREHIGLIAEEVPDEMASVDRKGIPTADAIAFLTAALKAQQAQIENLKETVKELQESRK